MKLSVRVQAAILAAVMLLCVMPIGASAEVRDDFYVDIFDDHCRIFGYRGKEKTVRIPSEADGKPVTEVDGEPYLEYWHSVEEIIIPDSVEWIRPTAFFECERLKKVDIPGSVYIIDDMAFYGCMSLTEITIPAGVNEIGDGVFGECVLLERVQIADGLKKIGADAFGGCAELEEIYIPSSVTEIGGDIFRECGKLGRIEVDANNPRYVSGGNCLIDRTDGTLISGCRSSVIPEDGTVSAVGEYSFYCRNGIVRLNIPEGVGTIGKFAFMNCKDLMSVSIPISTTEIAQYAFAGTALTDAYYAGTAEDWEKINIAEGNEQLIYNAEIHFGVEFPSPLRLVSSSVSDGAVAAGDDLILHFDRNIAVNPDVNSGQAIRIITEENVGRYYDSYAVTDGGFISGDTLTVPGALRGLSGKRCRLTVSRDFIRSADDGSVRFGGIADGELTFLRSFDAVSDGNSFTHSNRNEESGFYGIHDYAMSERAFEKLTEGLSAAEKDSIKKKKNSEWGGSCYGIATTAALVYEGELSVSDISRSGKSYGSMTRPADNMRLLSSINYYYLTQYIKDLPMYGARGYSTALKRLIEILDGGECAVFCFARANYGHAIVALDYEVNGDEYVVRMYDENLRGYRYLTVDRDFENFRLSRDSDGSGSEKIARMGVYSPGEIYYGKPYGDTAAYASPMSLSGGGAYCRFTLDADADYTVTNGAGETLIYRYGEFSGTMQVYEYSGTVDENGGEWILKVPLSDSYTVEFADGTGEVAFTADSSFRSVSCDGAERAEIDMNGEITVSGSGRYGFVTYISTDEAVGENETNLISLSAVGEGAVSVGYSVAGGTVRAESDGELEMNFARAYVGVYSVELSDMTPDGDGVIAVTAEPQRLPFGDVSDGAWYRDAAEYVYRNSLMNGMSPTTFEPDRSMSRAMLVTVLWRMNSSPAVSGAAPFADLKQGWYRDAVAWAYENGIVNGKSATEFDPDGDITREQLATIMFRYAASCGADVSDRVPLEFPDAADTHGYAEDAMGWACAVGLIGGADGRLLPRRCASRAQVATIIMRYREEF